MLVAAGIQIVRAIGVKKLIPILAVAAWRWGFWPAAARAMRVRKRRRSEPLLHPHVIASEAKQSTLSSCGEMDCFASLAMTKRRALTISRHNVPELWLEISLPSANSEGAGNAGCTLHPRSHAQRAQKVRA